LLLRRLKLLAACPAQKLEQEIQLVQRQVEHIRTEMRDIKKGSIAMSASLIDEEGLIRMMKDLDRERSTVRGRTERFKLELQRCLDSIKELEGKSAEATTQLRDLEYRTKEIDQADMERQAQ
jgi:predicted  nucleic acid-binding Zn-ribbon protein